MLVRHQEYSIVCKDHVHEEIQNTKSMAKLILRINQAPNEQHPRGILAMNNNKRRRRRKREREKDGDNVCGLVFMEDE